MCILHTTICIRFMKPTIKIEYCPKCHWMMKAAYMAQEFLTTFSEELYSVELIPSEISGRYIIYVNDSKIFERKESGQFIEVKLLKQIIRDIIAPDKDLGHSDKK